MLPLRVKAGCFVESEWIRNARPQQQPHVIILETERLTLREITSADAEFFVEVLNDPEFIRFVADRGVRTTEDAANYIATKIRPSYAQFGFGFYIVELKQNAQPIGICGLVKRETLEHVDIGFSLLQRFCGNGYAYEAAAAIHAHGRSVLGLSKIVAVTAPDNASSAKLLEKLGLRFEKMIHLPGYGLESRLFS